MPIHWYPGHMAKAKKALALSLPRADVVIEVRDARAPKASGSPVLAELRGDTPCVLVLAKADLADPEVTPLWLEGLSRDAPRVVAMASTAERPAETKRRVLEKCRALAPRAGARKTRIVIVGVPNVGKSTLINALAGRKVAKVGDIPAVTRMTQDVVLGDDFVLTDNPGLLFPKLDDQDVALRLALTGALPDTILDFVEVGAFAAGWLLASYPALVAARYGQDPLPTTAFELLEAIGRRRGALQPGGVVDLHKAADVLIHDVRSGALGRVSVERP
jgi:ribosome biogenesis GTPase A